jgi:hypothetical protein
MDLSRTPDWQALVAGADDLATRPLPPQPKCRGCGEPVGMPGLCSECVDTYRSEAWEDPGLGDDD